MTRQGPRKYAKEHLMKARDRMAKDHATTGPRSEQALITAIRQTRDQLWEAKLAPRS